MKRAILVLLAAASLQALAQNETDLLRYSQQFPAGTSRALAMGGAFGAVGADLSAGAINPAGFGVYRRSVFSFTPGMQFNGVNSQFLGTSSNDSRTGMTLNNWGMAFAVRTGRKEGVRNWTFAFGQNQLANYHRTLRANGYNTQSSITDYFAQEANGTAASDLSGIAGMAFNAFLINPVYDRTNQYFGAVQNGEDKTAQELRIRGVAQQIYQAESGRNNEWFVGTGLNISDILYVGATLGIQQVRFTRTFSVTEADAEDMHTFFVDEEDQPQDYPLEFPFDHMRYQETVDALGTGVNLKLGAIVQPTDFLRFGISMQTPTTLEMRENFGYNMTHDMREAKSQPDFYTLIVVPIDSAGGSVADAYDESVDGTYDYRVVTPFRATASAMILFGKTAFITADAEFVDYSQGMLKSNYSDNPFVVANNNVIDLYTNAVNLRLGGELRFGTARLRAGYALYGSPLTEEASSYLAENGERLSINAATTCYTVGAGIREKSYFADIAVVYAQGNDKFRPYNLSDTQFSPTVVNAFTRTNINFTVGFILGDNEE